LELNGFMGFNKEDKSQVELFAYFQNGRFLSALLAMVGCCLGG